MATVTGLTAERMLEIEAASVIDGDVDVDGHLILTQHGGDTIDAGSVVGPPGPEGPMGSDLDVIVQQSIFDIGMPNQIRAGRTLSVDDFTDLGLTAPEALWNLSNLNDSSGNGHGLTDKGSVGFVRGVDGVDTHGAEFSGVNALYINDVGSADPFRVRVGTFAAWVRTAKQGVFQSILTKRGASGQLGWWLRIRDTNVASFGCSATGTTLLEVNGLSRICDNRWHFIVGVFDGVLQQLYVDGVLEASALRGATGTELIFGSNSPLNVGSYGANSSVAVAEPLFGRVDEAFVTTEILSDEKIYNLYCTKILHSLGSIPSGVSLNVYSGSKGASLLSSDFPTAPLRLHNFSNGSLGDDGVNGVPLSVIGTPVKVAGVDGTKDNAYNLSSTQRFTATDTGLPSGTSPTSYGCWIKCSNGVASALYIITWGTTNGTNDNRLYLVQGNITFGNGGGTPVAGPFIADGNWHFVVVTQENAPSDGVKRKFYVDGRLVASSTVLNSVTPGGPNKFVVGSSLTSASNLIGEIDTVFVTDYVLGMADITKLYVKSLVDHLPSPKNAGDHVQAMDDTYLLVAFDTLDIADKVSLKVMA